MIAQITPTELAAWRADTGRPAPAIIDVREPWEYERCHIEGSQHIPLREIPARAAEIPDDRDIVLMCHHGGRSLQAAGWLERNGLTRLHNLAGGIDAWARTVDPAMARY